MNPAASLWAVVPAAGVGKRMQAASAKQYLSLNSTPVLQHTLQRLLCVPALRGVVIAIREDDKRWPQLQFDTTLPIHVVAGGEARSDSVRNALTFLHQHPAFDTAQDWVLVHDAVRPCVRVHDIERLISLAMQRPHGGLLAVPVRDTMKRQNAACQIDHTVAREGLWHALTPQLFPGDLLFAAIQQAQARGENVTDEASAMEAAGYHPLLVAGHEDNIKITRPGDLALAELYLNHQQATQ